MVVTCRIPGANSMVSSAIQPVKDQAYQLISALHLNSRSPSQIGRAIRYCTTLRDITVSAADINIAGS